nr:hypothetical protein [Tanacetum cinerariifolium]
HTQEEAATLREIVESERLLRIRRTQKKAKETEVEDHLRTVKSSLNKARVALVSNARGSQSKDNTEKNRIRRTLKEAKETELEDHSRKVKSSLNKASVVASRASSSNT